MNTVEPTVRRKARFESLDSLVAGLLPCYLHPLPKKPALRRWFEREGIPSLQANPRANRGGGQKFYNVAAIEKLLNGGGQ